MKNNATQTSARQVMLDMIASWCPGSGTRRLGRRYQTKGQDPV